MVDFAHDAHFSSPITYRPSTPNTLQVGLDAACRVFQHLFREGGLDADPEGVVHDNVGLGQVAADAVVLAFHVGLAGEIAGEEQSGADFVLVEGGQSRSAAWVVSPGTERS